MAVKLSPQREKFAQCIVKGMSQSDAYRKAFPNSLKWKDKTVHARASEMAADGMVKGRAQELRKPVVAKVRYELEDAMSEADAARVLAMSDPKGAAAAVSAVQLKARLNGLMVEDRKNDRRPLSDIDDAELTTLIERAAKDAGIGVTLQ